ncbi:MAG: transposase, partial [Proteobacteria bacterium]|nr:transposase [Pseudomonadota bacterium]
MPIARAEQVSVEVTPWYHVMSRCVRRAFLCGQDQVSGKNFDHRKGWLADKM